MEITVSNENAGQREAMLALSLVGQVLPMQAAPETFLLEIARMTTMPDLTKELIEEIRHYGTHIIGYEKRTETIIALCDLALKGLTITRPEASSAEAAIREHNQGCLEACGKTSSHQYVKDSRRCDERRDCPECPKDWMIEWPSLTPSPPLAREKS